MSESTVFDILTKVLIWRPMYVSAAKLQSSGVNQNVGRCEIVRVG